MLKEVQQLVAKWKISKSLSHCGICFVCLKVLTNLSQKNIYIQKPMKELALVASMEAEQPLRAKCVWADNLDLNQHQGLDKTHKELV